MIPWLGTVVMAWVAHATPVPVAPEEPPDATARDAHTVELGAGALPACGGQVGLAPCVRVVQARAHGDHRLPRAFLVAWDLVAERRGWQSALVDVGEVHAAWRGQASLGLGWHGEYVWGDMRVYVGPSVEVVGVEHSRLGTAGEPAVADLAWLDPGAADAGRTPGWLDLGLVVGNDLDWPLGPVRLGFRWLYRLGGDVALLGGEGDLDALSGLDVWELHATSLAVPTRGPVAAYLEVGWTNQFTLPLRAPGFRVAPWLLVGLEFRAGRTSPRSPAHRPL
ncbi:MAG: hypothetical protein H6732_16455 [Alphaproteobacteria bacterium]|nr:hypothetical protein [Alphaproteobacteria bacterium]